MRNFCDQIFENLCEKNNEKISRKIMRKFREKTETMQKNKTPFKLE